MESLSGNSLGLAKICPTLNPNPEKHPVQTRTARRAPNELQKLARTQVHVIIHFENVREVARAAEETPGGWVPGPFRIMGRIHSELTAVGSAAEAIEFEADELETAVMRGSGTRSQQCKMPRQQEPSTRVAVRRSPC